MEAAFPRSRWGLCRRGPLASRWAALLLLLALTCTAVRSSPALEVSEGVASAAGNAATEEGAALASRRGLASVGRGRRRSWVSDMDKFLDGNKGISTRLRRKKQQRSIGGDSILSKYGGLFPCRWKPLNVPLPFQWFCHPADKDLSLEDPAGPVVLTRHGQVLGMGPHIYSFQPKIEGPARILYKGVEVGTFKARLDGCKCPLPFRTFTHEYGCGQQDAARLKKLFARWLPRSVTRKIMDDFWEHRPPGTATHIAILKNEIYYRHTDGPWAWSWPTFERLLTSVVHKVKLPDVEFYAHNSDWPQMSHIRVGPPLFSFTTDPMHSDIPMPVADHIKEAFSGAALRSVCKAKAWDERIPKAYFRGANTGDERMEHPDYIPFHPRFRAALMSQQRPDLLDVKICLSIADKVSDEAKAWVEKHNLTVETKSDPKERPWEFKYALDMDGFSAPYRTSFLMAGGSLLVKQTSPYEEYFYDELKHGVNSLQVDYNLQDLTQKIEWAKSHERESRKIAEEGFKFYWERLRQEDILCWMAQALRHAALVQEFKPGISPGMVKLNVTSDRTCAC